MTALACGIRRAAPIALAMGLVGVACGWDDSSGADGATADRDGVPTAGTTTESSPFVVENPPAGYHLVVAGRGDVRQTWSSDSFGDDEPVTVLAPPGADVSHPAAPGVVTVSLTGYAGFDRGLDQAVSGYPGARPEEFEIDGQRAIYTPPGASPAGPHRADLVVAVGEDLAVWVGSATGSREQLADVARRVRPQVDHLLAARIPDPPNGLEVAGSADADVAITLWARPEPGTDMVPAGTRAHAAVWVRLDASGAWTSRAPAITVSTLPGTAVSLDALAAALAARDYGRSATIRKASVRGIPGAVVDGGEDLIRFRALITSTPGGDALLVVASGGDLPDAQVLVDVAASVQRTTTEAWDALVVDARGGPGLRPDPGAVELERGKEEGFEWLFQARIDDGSIEMDPAAGKSGTKGQFVIDPCLKFADGQRACPNAGSSAAQARVIIRTGGPMYDRGHFPGFIMVSTTQPAAVLRVTTANGIHEGRFHELPDGKERGAVVVTDHAGLWACDTRYGGHPVVELLDGEGQPLPCE